jgi:signal peptidase II
MFAAIREWLVFGTIVTVALAADLATKESAFRELGMPGMGNRHVLIPGIFVFETNLNEGALFGMGQGMGMVFAAVATVALAGILWMVSSSATRANTWLLTALALISGGILGNLYDRLGFPGLAWHAPLERVGQPVYAVRDWIHVTVPGVIDWPIFNIADSWLVIGAGMLLVTAMRPDPVASEQVPLAPEATREAS